jgi:hypothetical protein
MTPTESTLAPSDRGFPSFSHIAIALALSQAAVASSFGFLTQTASQLLLAQTPSTQGHVTMHPVVSDVVVLGALADLHTILLNEAEELSDRASDILDKNLWDLYL